jgi:hypothetical protein
MMPFVSIVMPGIRPQNWEASFHSILDATSHQFELIIVSPFELPSTLLKYSQIKIVKDFGSPARANQIGVSLAVGKILYPNHSDDALFLPKAIDDNINLLLSLGDSKKNIVTCKYSESQGFSHPNRFQPDEYYLLKNAYPLKKELIPDNWYILNGPFWHREYFVSLGGYDCIFQVCPIAHADLALRAHIDGANIVLSQIPITKNDHNQSDHGPIEFCQINIDGPILYQKYLAPFNSIQKNIPIDNWKKAPTIWNLRFQV